MLSAIFYRNSGADIKEIPGGGLGHLCIGRPSNILNFDIRENFGDNQTNMADGYVFMNSSKTINNSFLDFNFNENFKQTASVIV